MKPDTIYFLLYLSFVHVTLCKSSDESATPSPSSHPSSTTSSPSLQPVQQQQQTSSSSFSTSLNIKCDPTRYYGTGCPDHQTTICDPKRLECVCRTGSIVIEGRCMTIKSIDEPCYSSKECETTSGAKCINTFGEIESLPGRPGSNKAQDGDSSAGTGQLAANTPNIFFNLHAGYCQCPNGFYHHQEKEKCIRRLIGSKCQNNTECLPSSTASATLNKVDAFVTWDSLWTRSQISASQSLQQLAIQVTRVSPVPGRRRSASMA